MEEEGAVTRFRDDDEDGCSRRPGDEQGELLDETGDERQEDPFDEIPTDDDKLVRVLFSFLFEEDEEDEGDEEEVAAAISG